MIFFKLFLSFFQVGLFSIGGGYAALPLMQEQVVSQNHWLSMREFTNLITIAEMTPGPIAINSATFVGTRIAGFPGALLATFGCILPSCIIVTIFFFVYRRYSRMSAMQNVLASLRPAVVALIFAAGLSILKLVVFSGADPSIDNLNFLGCALFIGAFFLLRKYKLNPIIVMLICGVTELLLGIALPAAT